MLLRSVALQEAEPQEIQAYRRTVRALYAESDKLDAAAIRAGSKGLRELQAQLADRLEVLKAKGELTPRKLGEVQKEIQALSGAWAQNLLRHNKESFGPRAYELGDQLAVKGVVAAGLKLALDPRSELDLVHSVQLDEKYAYRAAAEATQSAMKLVRMHALGGRSWGDVLRNLKADPSKGESYWYGALRSTETAARTWAAKAQADGSLRRLTELADRTNGAVKMLYVLLDTKGACSKCPPHSGKVYEVRGGQAPKLPLHPDCRCSYLPWYDRGAASGGPGDPVTPAPAGAKSFEGVTGVEPSRRYAYLNKDARPVLDSPFDERGLNYSEDCLQQPAPGIPPVRDLTKFLAENSEMRTTDGKVMQAEQTLRTHVVGGGDHGAADGENRTLWLEALPRLLANPEFSGRVSPGKSCWVGRFRQGQQTRFVIAIAREGQTAYNLETFITTGRLGYAKRWVKEIQDGKTLPS